MVAALVRRLPGDYIICKIRFFLNLFKLQMYYLLWTFVVPQSHKEHVGVSLELSFGFKEAINGNVTAYLY